MQSIAHFQNSLRFSFSLYTTVIGFLPFSLFLSFWLARTQSFFISCHQILSRGRPQSSQALAASARHHITDWVIMQLYSWIIPYAIWAWIIPSASRSGMNILKWWYNNLFLHVIWKCYIIVRKCETINTGGGLLTMQLPASLIARLSDSLARLELLVCLLRKFIFHYWYYQLWWNR